MCAKLTFSRTENGFSAVRSARLLSGLRLLSRP